jgi:hypothetical protein
MRNELGVVTAADRAQHQEALEEGRDERAEHHLVAEVAQEISQ